MPWTKEEQKFLSLLIWRENHSKRCKQNFTGSSINNYPQKAKFIVGYTNFQSQGQ